MAKECNKGNLQSLPECARDFIKLVIRKMRYRKKVRADVHAELSAHFEDELKDCATDEEKQQKAQRVIEDFGDVELLAVLLRRAKKRCRPLWRTIAARTFQTVGVLILCFTLYVIWFLTGRPAVAVDYVAELNRLVKPVADESLNAAPFFDEAVVSSPNMPDKEALFWSKSYADTNDAERQIIEAWLNDSLHGFALVSEGVRKPYHWQQYRTAGTGEDVNSVMNILLPHLAKYRELARGLCWRAQMKAAKVQYEPAFEDLVTCYKFGQLIKGGEKTLIEQLVGIAIQIMAVKDMRMILCNQKVDSQSLKNLQAKLEDLAAEDTYVMSYEVEKFCALDFVQRCYTDNGRGSGHMIPGQLKNFSDSLNSPGKGIFEGLAMALVSANRDKMSREFEKIYNTAQKWATTTPWQLHKENVDFEVDVSNWSTLKRARYWPVGMLMPVFGTVNKMAYRHKTNIEALITTLAIIRFKQSTGDYPESLDDLVAAGYLKNLPMDPWSDKPLVYKKTADAFTLYGVGSNFKDDGGQVVRDGNGKAKPYADEGDWVFWPVPK